MDPPQHGTGAHQLARWRENVGLPVAADYAPQRHGDGGEPASTLVVVSWNVWIGSGRLASLIRQIRAGSFPGVANPAGTALVVLVQEAYRGDGSIPPISNGASGRDRRARPQPPEDVVDVARSLALNLRYAPSMRNGSLPSDRGNAILSTLPVTDAAAFELPWVLQRRVAVVATVTLTCRGAAPVKFRVCSAHLDPRGMAGRDWLGTMGRELQTRELLAGLGRHGGKTATPHILGADLNLARGPREPAYRLLAGAGFTSGVPERPLGWDHTYHAVPRLPLDYLLFQHCGAAIASAEVRRLDEHPDDWGLYVFGSDHHPLLAQVFLNPPERDPRHRHPEPAVAV